MSGILISDVADILVGRAAVQCRGLPATLNAVPQPPAARPGTLSAGGAHPAMLPSITFDQGAGFRIVVLEDEGGA